VNTAREVCSAAVALVGLSVLGDVASVQGIREELRGVAEAAPLVVLAEVTAVEG
jgi:hypothetical protein